MVIRIEDIMVLYIVIHISFIYKSEYAGGGVQMSAIQMRKVD
jgi:hypothetical protein